MVSVAENSVSMVAGECEEVAIVQEQVVAVTSVAGERLYARKA